MKQSFYVYNNGDLKRKDNTLQFTNYDGEKRDIPIERISDIYVMSEMSFNTKFINYRPTAEFFDGIIDNGENQKLRNLGPIDIADNVYICSNVILYPNVKIGKNCLILDGSVITTSIEENSVVMGNPARVIAKIDDWYLNIKNINLKYPWYNKNISHDEIVRQREQYFFEGKQHEY